MPPSPCAAARSWCNVPSNAPSDAGRVVKALIARPTARRVNFTGSSKMGKIVAKICAEHLKPVLSELGGTSPLLVLEDGRQIALTRSGIGFPPSFLGSGPLPGAPQVVCWRDFRGVIERVEHVVTHHRDEKPTTEVLDMLMYCVAIVDGARAAGFEVDREEHRLERVLQAIETASK